MNRVVLKPCEKDKFELVESYGYECGFGRVDIPSGYKTNGANIPRILWSFYPPNSPEYLSAVVIHDYLCDKAYQNDKNYEDFILADNIFFIALKELGVDRFKSALFYLSCKTYHYLKYKLLRRK
ncbi:DUF1353 domain-containing protein [Campylobacter sp. RM12637]|uniref:DUF1353 domain-containing protein n=1 Tax=Campylobacter sp. RM12637 TaxID=2735734 RepID=UPI003014DA01|nr:DUF1353 domain-containing protein [Campylobacter sp. RM12637]